MSREKRKSHVEIFDILEISILISRHEIMLLLYFKTHSCVGFTFRELESRRFEAVREMQRITARDYLRQNCHSLLLTTHILRNTTHTKFFYEL